MKHVSSRAMLALFVAFIPAVYAQDASIDEIIVTSELRQQSINEVATSISVLDAAEIDQLADQHFEELIRALPNMNWSGDGHRARYFQIRGVGELEQYQGAPNPSVGFLIDDIDFSGIGTVGTLFDIERVEVLRGPQGSRYGANALGGLIYLRSTTPGSGADNVVELGLADEDTRSLAAAFGAELSDELAFRISAQRYESNGFRNNVTLGRDDTNGRDETSLRTRIRWQPSAMTTADVSLMFVDVDNGYDAFSLDNSLTMLSDKPGRDTQESVGLSLRLQHDAGDAFAIESITTWADSAIRFGFDADWGSDASWAPFIYDYVSDSDRERETLSQEIRLLSNAPIFRDSTDWVLGVYAQRLDESLLSTNEGDYFDPIFDFADSLNDVFDSRYRATNVAAFGRLVTRLGDRTELQTGLRLERRTTDYSDSALLTADPSETMLGGELSLLRELSSGHRVYATLSSGFRAGGFNLGIVPDDRREFEQERLWNFELGTRMDIGAMRLDAAVFYNRRDDQQVRTSFQLVPGDPASFIFLTDNAARGESIGLELEADWQIGADWTAFLNVGLLEASFDRFDSPLAGLDGRDQAHAPSYTLAGGVAYRPEEGLFFSVDVSATDAFYFDVSHDQRSDAYALVNLQLGYASGPWTLTAWMRNALDENYAVRGFFFGNEPPNFEATLYTRQGDPRLTGLTLRRSF